MVATMNWPIVSIGYVKRLLPYKRHRFWIIRSCTRGAGAMTRLRERRQELISPAVDVVFG
jgi:hypothetical protein